MNQRIHRRKTFFLSSHDVDCDIWLLSMRENIVALLWRPSSPQSLVMLPAKMSWRPSGPQSLVMLPAKMRYL